MSKRIFTKEEIQKLKSNPCVKECSDRYIIYTEEFKNRAIEQHRNGTTPRDIFERVGINVQMVPKDHPKECLKRWRRIMRRQSEGGFTIKSKKQTEVTEAERIKHLELQVKYLKAENDFLAKLRAKRVE